MGVSIVMGVPQNGLCFLGKIPSRNGWWLGVPHFRKPPSSVWTGFNLMEYIVIEFLDNSCLLQDSSTHFPHISGKPRSWMASSGSGGHVLSEVGCLKYGWLYPQFCSRSRQTTQQNKYPQMMKLDLWLRGRAGLRSQAVWLGDVGMGQLRVRISSCARGVFGCAVPLDQHVRYLFTHIDSDLECEHFDAFKFNMCRWMSFASTFLQPNTGIRHLMGALCPIMKSTGSHNWSKKI